MRADKKTCRRRLDDDQVTIFYSVGNSHVAQLVTGAVFNAEHAGPGIPAHHRGESDLARLHATGSREAKAT